MQNTALICQSILNGFYPAQIKTVLNQSKYMQLCRSSDWRNDPETVWQIARSALADGLSGLACFCLKLLQSRGASLADIQPELSSLLKKEGLELSLAKLQDASGASPKISLYIPAFNAEKYMRAVLEAAQTQSLAALEIIVIDDGSADATAQIASQFNNVLVHRHQKNLGLGAARNSAIALARGDFIAALDSDVLADPLWLERLYLRLINTAASGVGGYLAERNCAIGANYWREKILCMHHGEKPQTETFIFGSNSLFETKALRQLNGYSDFYTKCCDDTDLMNRLRDAELSTCYEPKALCTHLRHDSLHSVLDTCYNWRLPPLLETEIFSKLELLAYKYVKQSQNDEKLIEAQIIKEELSLAPISLLLIFYSLARDLTHYALQSTEKYAELHAAYLIMKLMQQAFTIEPLPDLIRCALASEMQEHKTARSFSFEQVQAVTLSKQELDLLPDSAAHILAHSQELLDRYSDLLKPVLGCLFSDPSSSSATNLICAEQAISFERYQQISEKLRLNTALSFNLGFEGLQYKLRASCAQKLIIEHPKDKAERSFLETVLLMCLNIAPDCEIIIAEQNAGGITLIPIAQYQF